jgi:hypothetical protein
MGLLVSTTKSASWCLQVSIRSPSARRSGHGNRGIIRRFLHGSQERSEERTSTRTQSARRPGVEVGLATGGRHKAAPSASSHFSSSAA